MRWEKKGKGLRRRLQYKERKIWREKKGKGWM
jgi:hypothetical protein